MARRVSEHIEHHAKRARDHIVRHASRIPPPVRVAFGIFVGIIIILSAFFYREEAIVKRNTLTAPLKCSELTFPSNRELCIVNIETALEKLHGVERNTICDRTKDRRAYGINLSLCDEYDTAMTEQLYRAALNDRGISIWSPDEITSTAGKTLVVKSLAPLSDLHLVCNAQIVPITREKTNEGYSVTLEKPVVGSCTLVGKTTDGTVTSAPFKLTE